jgi:hypothetical protein
MPHPVTATPLTKVNFKNKATASLGRELRLLKLPEYCLQAREL